jgi:hypothetical protein
MNVISLKGGYGKLNERLVWTDQNGIEQTLGCYDSDGKTKGLGQIARELGYAVKAGMKLYELKELVKDHPAFNSCSRLENLAKKYEVNIIFCPKYHCEMNPIEGFYYVLVYLSIKIDINLCTF